MRPTHPISEVNDGCLYCGVEQPLCSLTDRCYCDAVSCPTCQRNGTCCEMARCESCTRAFPIDAMDYDNAASLYWCRACDAELAADAAEEALADAHPRVRALARGVRARGRTFVWVPRSSWAGLPWVCPTEGVA